jgi:hypothetical protein
VSSLTGVVVALGIAGYMFVPRSEAKALFPQYESVAYRAAGNKPPKPQAVYRAMAKHSWLQANGDISNPYFADPAMRGAAK